MRVDYATYILQIREGLKSVGIAIGIRNPEDDSIPVVVQSFMENERTLAKIRDQDSNLTYLWLLYKNVIRGTSNETILDRNSEAGLQPTSADENRDTESATTSASPFLTKHMEIIGKMLREDIRNTTCMVGTKIQFPSNESTNLSL
jgi:hypothetical protein